MPGGRKPKRAAARGKRKHSGVPEGLCALRRCCGIRMLVLRVLDFEVGDDGPSIDLGVNGEPARDGTALGAL